MRWLGLGLFMFLCAVVEAAPVSRTLLQFEAECGASNYAVNDSLLSFDNIRSLVENKKVKSPRELVAAMGGDADFRPFVSSHLLIHTSRSTQRESADRESPRIVLYDRGLVVAVTDHPAKPNPHVEVINYDKASHEFKFGLIDFSKGQPFDSRPTSCADCHGEKKLPIWPTYRVWPGAYNHHNSYFYVSNPALNLLTDAEREEKKRRLDQLTLETFRGRSPSSLPEFNQLRELFGVVLRERKGAHAHLERARNGEDTAAFNSFLSRLNFDRIAHELKSSREYAKYRYALMGALLKCDDLPEFLGARRVAHDRDWGTMSYAAIRAEVATEMEREFRARRAYAMRIGDTENALSNDMNDEYDIDRLAGIRYLFEKRGVDVKRFSMNFAPATSHGWGFSELGAGNGGLRMSFCHFVPDLVRADAVLSPLLELSPHGYNAGRDEEKRFCNLLKQKSRAALE